MSYPYDYSMIRGLSMKDFPHVRLNAMSMAQRSQVFGVGINNADYAVHVTTNGNQTRCPYYKKWADMLKRCYSNKFQEKQPTYKGCSVCDDWLLFSNFRKWMVKQDWKGMELDKDIKVKGNKVYAPDKCLFIPRALNSLLLDNATSRGAWPAGVVLDKRRGKFQARIKYSGKTKHLGMFQSEAEASACYQEARTVKIQKLITDDIYPMATQYLAQYIRG